MTMKRMVLMISAVCMLAVAVGAAPWAMTYALTSGTVALTNRQANSVWMPAAVLCSFAQSSSGTVSVSRVSQGNTFLLGRLAATNASTVIWVPDAEYPFEYGDALEVSSTVTNGSVQIIRIGN
jgi:hypothetical protein